MFRFDIANIRRQQLNYQIFFEVFLNYFHFPSVYGASQGLQMQYFPTSLILTILIYCKSVSYVV